MPYSSKDQRRQPRQNARSGRSARTNALQPDVHVAPDDDFPPPADVYADPDELPVTAAAQDNVQTTSGVRLQKVLAAAGLASRRAAERLIAEGHVSINGQTVQHMGIRVDPHHDQIRVDGQPLGSAVARYYVLIHKPRGTVCSANDPEQRPTVFDAVRSRFPRLFSVGRLDYDSSGALLLTNDGDLAARLIHPRYHVAKIYWLKLDRPLPPETLRRLQTGIRLDDGPTLPCSWQTLPSPGQHYWYEVRMHEGRNRQLRRMCEAVGARALKVFRASFAGLTIQDLGSGAFRALRLEEVERLRRIVGLAAPKRRIRVGRTRPEAD